MKLHFSKEWLRKKIEEDPDTPVEVGQAGTCVPNTAYLELRDAMQDLLLSPKGVMPGSAEPFYDAKAGRISSTKVREHLEK